jgi:hypothetical protein
MANSSVVFSNQDGQVPISTHPARAHKHAAPQPVPEGRLLSQNKKRKQNNNPSVGRFSGLFRGESFTI